MSVTWTYIPAQAGLTIPEQWQARVCEKTVAVLRRDRRADGSWIGGTWSTVMQGPDGTIASLIVTNSVTDQAHVEVEHALYQMGWR